MRSYLAQPQKPPNPHANIHPSHWNIDGKTKATGWGKKTGSINLSENKGSVSLGRGFSSSLMAPFLHPCFFLTFIFYANKVSMNMNMIELRSPSLSKIQQKPEHPVGWFTIVTLHASYFQTFKHLNQVHWVIKTGENILWGRELSYEKREAFSTGGGGGTSFLSFLFSFFQFFFSKMPHNLGVHSVSMLSKALSWHRLPLLW